MVIVTTSYAEREADLRAVRDAVFIVEQAVPADLEFDACDLRCVHVLALDGDRPVGTARVDLDYDGKIGRVAVLAEYRGRGIGIRLLESVERIAREWGLESTWLNAQAGAVSFYEKLGYRLEGEPFVEAGIPHRRMRKFLRRIAQDD
jgi:predicted GNAT family N-acyltransferase